MNTTATTPRQQTHCPTRAHRRSNAPHCGYHTHHGRTYERMPRDRQRMTRPYHEPARGGRWSTGRKTRHD